MTFKKIKLKNTGKIMSGAMTEAEEGRLINQDTIRLQIQLKWQRQVHSQLVKMNIKTEFWNKMNCKRKILIK